MLNLIKQLDEGLANPVSFKALQQDGYLHPFAQHFSARTKQLLTTLQNILKHQKSLLDFAKSYQRFGLHRQSSGLVTYREWAPGASELELYGEFNEWKTGQNKGKKDEFGVWVVEDLDIKHNSKVKARLRLPDGSWADRVPAWIKFTHQDPTSKHFDGVFWDPPEPYKFEHPKPDLQEQLRIYECHVGMSGIGCHLHTYDHFRQYVLPRVRELGYNVLQIMAIMEHPYYGSFGYQVSSFFAVSSRFGTPDQFKRLVDEAHGMGIKVLIDLVHSHAVSNVNQGLNFFDGTDYQYFHSLPKGRHELWDSRLFDYSKYEVQRFLLSNVAMYMLDYNVDGFRFDGVTSMLYHHHGIGVGFSGDYREYFGLSTDISALVLLALQNLIVHEIDPNAITIAEDVSGYPTLCRPVEEGGLGFDYRFSMAIPDNWIKLLKESKDEEWQMGNLVRVMTDRRRNQKCIAYAECHDQALVGDKTLSMWLLDKQIYTNMGRSTEQTVVVNRALALHKMIRLLTYSLGGEGYLNFMGNEFGHPQWIDFPREGNNWSFVHCRRQWDLADRPDLRYSYLLGFDKAMLTARGHMTAQPHVLWVHEDDKTIIFTRSKYLFVFNFHPTKSFTDYLIAERVQCQFKVKFSTDDHCFGGHGRVWHNEYKCSAEEGFKMYLPNRTAIVLEKIQ